MLIKSKRVKSKRPGLIFPFWRGIFLFIFLLEVLPDFFNLLFGVPVNFSAKVAGYLQILVIFKNGIDLLLRKARYNIFNNLFVAGAVVLYLLKSKKVGVQLFGYIISAISSGRLPCSNKSLTGGSFLTASSITWRAFSEVPPIS